jgi:hypothetical protein
MRAGEGQELDRVALSVCVRPVVGRDDEGA